MYDPSERATECESTFMHVYGQNKALCLDQATYGRDSVSSLVVFSPFGRENENHIEHFHRSDLIVMKYCGLQLHYICSILKICVVFVTAVFLLSVE